MTEQPPPEPPRDLPTCFNEMGALENLFHTNTNDVGKLRHFFDRFGFSEMDNLHLDGQHFD